MNEGLQHELAIQMMREVMDLLKDDLPYERRLSAMYAIYYKIKAALERYEEQVDRRELRLYGPHAKTTDN